ncbi:MAG TPA: hypothetical protein VHA56_16305 [Mucilaginibacter sp.]|nr:hypothetical protein [Mucilaginibacter sp.]
MNSNELISGTGFRYTGHIFSLRSQPYLVYSADTCGLVTADGAPVATVWSPDGSDQDGEFMVLIMPFGTLKIYYSQCVAALLPVA